MKQPSEADGDSDVYNLLSSLFENVADQDILAASKLSGITAHLDLFRREANAKIRASMKALLSNVSADFTSKHLILSHNYLYF